jgi:hypothetical protein
VTCRAIRIRSVDRNASTPGRSGAGASQHRPSSRSGWPSCSRCFCHRYGGAPLPDDDAGRDDLKLAFQVLSTTGNAGHRMVDVARTWAQWMPADELAALVADVTAHPRRFKADTVAARLGIDAETRALLKLRTIGSIDKPAEQRVAERREQKRLSKEAKRRAVGSVPRPVYEQASKQRGQPWRVLGISRRTWYRQQIRSSLVDLHIDYPQ